ncbi:MAG: CBS domain-containing protein [Gemmatimonadales bacterium]|nr:MAG: CBS domain-containing protein [Gemmatimonadales bacterium]
MKTLQRVIETKGDQIFSIGPDASVFDALTEMSARDVGALLVLENGKVVGIFSERDYARKIILVGKSSHETPVREIMTARVVCARPDLTLEECLALMTDKRIRHLPVMDGEDLVGVVSIGDLVKGIIDDQRFLISQLEGYVSG